MINSRSIDDLHPRVADMARAFRSKCAEAGQPVLIYCTLRDEAYQAELYAQGRTKPGKIVTRAKPGYSYHNFALAFDFVPLASDGKTPLWNDIKTYAKCGALAESVGLEWGGSWKGFVDRPHCQYTGGLTLAELRAGKKLA